MGVSQNVTLFYVLQRYYVLQCTYSDTQDGDDRIGIIESACMGTFVESLHVTISPVGETGASCYRGRLLQGHFMQNYYIDDEIADSCFILIHQGNH